MRTYEINEHQKNILKEVLHLPTDNLYYIVVQQNIQGANYSLNELKKHIRRSVKEYLKRKGRRSIKFITFFETTHDFFMSQHTTAIVKTDFYSGFHFHLFISGVRKKSSRQFICKSCPKILLLI